MTSLSFHFVLLPATSAHGKHIEHSTKNKFEWLHAPQPKAILATAAETAVQDAVELPQQVGAHCGAKPFNHCLNTTLPPGLEVPDP